MSDRFDDGDSVVRPAAAPGRLRRLLLQPDRPSVLKLLVVLLGFPIAEFLADQLLTSRGVDARRSQRIAEAIAAVAVALAVYVLSRQYSLLGRERQRLEAELRTVSEHFRTMAENASDIVYSAGTDRCTTWVSPSVTKVLGWESSEVMGRSIASFLHPDDLAATEEVRRRIYSGEPYDTPAGGFVMRFQHKAGDYLWMAIHTKQVIDTNGQHQGVMGGLTLVQELVEARQRAESEESLLRLVSDAMLDPQVLMRAVRDGSGHAVDFTFVQVNRATCEYLHMSEDALVGRRFLEIAPQMAGSALFEQYLVAADAEAPLYLDNFPTPSYATGLIGYFDVRARRMDGDRLAITWRNVTAEHEMSRRLAESEIRFRLLAENSSDVIVLSDGEMHLNWVSPSSFATLGWRPEELLGHKASEYIHPDDLPALADAVARSNATGIEIRPRYRWRRPDGSYLWVEAAGKPVPDDGTGKPGRVVEIRDVDAQMRAQEQLQQRATFDVLTGALQREGAFDRLAEIEARPQAKDGATGVLFLDVDDFKLVNDQRGHATGDAVLRAVAERARAAVRGADVVARMGGDEFLVILEGVGNLDRALSVASKINATCALPIPTPSGECLSTVSIGVTLIGPGETADDTIARADFAMYAAKASGRNQVVAIPLG